jgi:H+-translocating NAD(P) transhydrogenase subunit beta
VPPFVLELAYVASAALFIRGLKLLGSPATARRGNAFSAGAMLLAVVATLLDRSIVSWEFIAVGIVTGTVIGTILARTVKMTAMPQLVGVFNGLGGGASALVATAELLRVGGVESPGIAAGTAAAAGILVGAVTFSGSFIAFGKLQGFVTGRPVTFPLQRFLNAALFLLLLAAAGHLAWWGPDPATIAGVAGLGLLLGILLVIPIGGADMPVVVSLLNSYSGLAAAAAGFVLGNPLLVLAGALVGAAGLILTQLMCRAMNRSLANVAFGAFGGESTVSGGGDEGEKTVRRTSADEAALLLAYASSVVIVPGYGLAVAQAQHEARKLTDLLRKRGVKVTFAIHPVAGRMPGHMNVLLAEADVPYDLLLDLDDVNPEFPRTDVVIVVGANDVVNPLARDPGSVIAGMPILDVDRAKNVIVIKRSLSSGFAGIDNPLFYLDNTMMLFADAREAMSDLAREVKDA